MRLIEKSDLPVVLSRLRKAQGKPCLAMYSSALGGVTTDAALMAVPIDDHMAHRGDAVFEVMKCVEGSIYNLREHLARLFHSARVIGLRPMPSRKRLTQIIRATARAGKERNCTVRVFVSRGTGTFGVNPYDCRGPQLYVAATRSPKAFMDVHPEGAGIITSSEPVKPGYFATIKTCNYLPNVLMAKEARDSNAHFAVAFDERGYLAEGATENVGIVTRGRELLFPRPGRILKGTTMMRVAELARRLVRQGALKRVAFENISLEKTKRAGEIILVGTSIDVVAVIRFDGERVGWGKPGPVFRKLRELLLRDIRRNGKVLTPVMRGECA